MAWVMFFESNDFQGGSVRFDQGTSVTNLKSVTLSNGHCANDSIKSMKLGPGSWLELYRDENFTKDKRCFEPDTVVRELGDYDTGGISSFKLHDARPPAWSGPSKPKNDESTFRMSPSPQKLTTQFGYVVSGLVGKIPELSGALGGLVGFLWPTMSNPKEKWAVIRKEVSELTGFQYPGIDADADALELRLEDLGSIVTHYLQASPYTPSKGGYFSDLLTQLGAAEVYFCDPASPDKSLIYFVNFASLYIAALREQVDHYIEIYSRYPGEPIEDKDRDAHLQLLKDKIKRYSDCAEQMRSTVLAWRLSFITLETDRYAYTGDPYYHVYDTFDSDHRFTYPTGVHDETDAQRADSVLKWRQLAIQDAYDAALIDLLFASRLWRYFDPGCKDKPASRPFYAVSGPFGGVGGSTFGGNVSGISAVRIDAWTSDRVQGLATSYGPSCGPVQGSTKATASTVTLEPGERIIAAYGKSGSAVDQMFLRTSQGREVGGGGAGGSSWSALAFGGDAPTLGGIAGRAAEGVDALLFYWLNYRDC